MILYPLVKLRFEKRAFVLVGDPLSPAAQILKYPVGSALTRNLRLEPHLRHYLTSLPFLSMLFLIKLTITQGMHYDCPNYFEKNCF